MKITNFRDVETEEVSAPGANGVSIRWLISEEDGAPDFALRLFEVKPGGHTPYHKHEMDLFIAPNEKPPLGGGFSNSYPDRFRLPGLSRALIYTAPVLCLSNSLLRKPLCAV